MFFEQSKSIIYRTSKQLVLLVVISFLSSIAVLESASAQQPLQNNVKSDYLVVVNRPNNLHFIDLSTEEIIRTCKLPSTVLPGTVVMSPDNLTAYVLAGLFDRIFGVDINNCNVVFDAKLSDDITRVKSMMSLAVSSDGREVFTIHNPVKIQKDHYEIQDTYFAVYSADGGLNAKPIRTYPVPRQINIIATGNDGRVYLSGSDVFVINPTTGKIDTAIKSLSERREGYGLPDVLTVWPLGRVSDEFVRMYSVPKFTDDTENIDTADWFWGYEKVDLVTGKTEVKDFGPVEEVFFTGMHRPKHPDEFYAVLTQLKRHKVSEVKAIKSIDLERTYYCINFATDGSKLYLGGTYNDIAVYDADSLTKLSNIVLPGGDMSLGTFQIFSLNKDQVNYTNQSKL